MKVGFLSRLAAITAAALFLAATESRANYSFTTATVAATTVLGGGGNTSTINLGPESGGPFVGSNGATLVEVADIIAGNGSTGSVTFTTTVTINQGPTDPVGTGTLTFNGTITWSKSDPTGQLSSFVLNNTSGPLTLSGVTYTFQAGSFSYTQPVINAPLGTSGTGAISANILTSSGVPEPASVVILGTGITGLFGLSLVRSRKRNIPG